LNFLVNEIFLNITNVFSFNLVNLVDDDVDVEECLLNEISNTFKMKMKICATFLKMLRTIREEHELIYSFKGLCSDNKIPRGLLIQGAKTIKSEYEKYLNVSKLDAINEMKPN